MVYNLTLEIQGVKLEVKKIYELQQYPRSMYDNEIIFHAKPYDPITGRVKEIDYNKKFFIIDVSKEYNSDIRKIEFDEVAMLKLIA